MTQPDPSDKKKKAKSRKAVLEKDSVKETKAKQCSKVFLLVPQLF